MTTTEADGRTTGDEMRRLDRWLAARTPREKVGLTIRDEHRAEAADLARRHGYALRLTELAEPGGVWAEFWPA
ncbi:hypothetical protein ACR9E3_10290 [Actinomycetospora sp. C-140]